MSTCRSTKDGFVCTNTRTHKGRHVARGINGMVMKAWKRAARTVTP
ncbi:hypothetical protein [Leifsonia sp. Leaf264]|nr:hypothetical protein [Leifsonia sp. Leaf264]